jgi:hypothetical protein
MTAERAAALHRHIARFLASSRPGDCAAVHYQKGGELSSAAECYARGAEEWLTQGDFSRALRCYERAVSCGASEATLDRACSAAAEASRLVGDRAPAERHARGRAGTLPAQQRQVRRRGGLHCWREGWDRRWVRLSAVLLLVVAFVVLRAIALEDPPRMLPNGSSNAAS